MARDYSRLPLHPQHMYPCCSSRGVAGIGRWTPLLATSAIAISRGYPALCHCADPRSVLAAPSRPSAAGNPNRTDSAQRFLDTIIAERRLAWRNILQPVRIALPCPHRQANACPQSSARIYDPPREIGQHRLCARVAPEPDRRKRPWRSLLASSNPRYSGDRRITLLIRKAGERDCALRPLPIPSSFHSSASRCADCCATYIPTRESSSSNSFHP